MYTDGENRLIQKELSFVLKSDYHPSKKINFYKKDGSLPLVWAINNIKTYKIPFFKKNIVKKLDNKIILKPLQEKCMKEIDKEFEKDIGGGVINLSTGSGKTVLSLYTIAKYSMKTLIIVNTIELMNQWRESIKKFLGDISVGIIQGDTFDINNHSITIGMVQTISMRKQYTKDMFTDFSICFIDECHHLSSEVFSEALFKCRTKYTFGLSATVERKDGLECIFKYHIGDVIFSDSMFKNNKQKPILKIINYKGCSSIPKYNFNGTVKVSTMITNISQDEERNNVILEVLLALGEDRKVLVLSDRIKQLEYLYKNLGGISGMFIGKTSKEDKIISKKKKILLATYNIASEGFDHPELNTLLFATPRSSVIQSIGRIYRKVHDIQPMIIDVVDQFSIFPHQYRKRNDIYIKHLCREKENECLFD